MNPSEELAVLVRSRNCVVACVTSDEARVEAAAFSVAEALGMEYRSWTIASGFAERKGRGEGASDPLLALGTVAGARGRCIYVLKDFHVFLDPANPTNVLNIRMLKDVRAALAGAGRSDTRAIVLTMPKLVMPDELAGVVAVLDWPMPDKDELAGAVREILSARGAEASGSGSTSVERIAEAAVGLTLTEAENVFAKSLVRTGALEAREVSVEKKRVVRREGLVDWIDIDPELDLSGYGGGSELKTWILERRRVFSAEAREYGLPMPKGIIVMGIPGAGKSMLARIVASVLGVICVKLDVGKLFGKYQGESEASVRKFIALVDNLGPCLVYIDELDKAFSGMASSGETDGGTSSRVLNTLLTWMAEKTTPAFLFATANNLDVLPPELLRAGRWDGIFAVDLPTQGEREEIWRIHITKRGRKGEAFDIPGLAKATAGFTGAEIEQAFIAAMTAAFNAGVEVGMPHVLAAVAKTIPLSKTASEKLTALRKWVKEGRAMPASKGETVTGDRFSGLEV